MYNLTVSYVFLRFAYVCIALLNTDRHVVYNNTVRNRPMWCNKRKGHPDFRHWCESTKKLITISNKICFEKHIEK